MIKVINISNQISKTTINDAVSCLKDNNILIYPTDTSYGAGVILNELALKRLDKLKDRTIGKYYSVIVPDFKWVKNNLDVNTTQENILRSYLPGEYTFILNKKYTNETLGIRMPKNNLVSLISKKINNPFTATSANISGADDSYSLADLQSGVLKNPNIINLNILILNSGQLERNKKSTVVDLTQNIPNILRQGSGKFII